MQISYPHLYIIENEKSIISGCLVFYNQMCYQLFGYMPFCSSIFVDLFTERGIIWIFVDIQNKQKKHKYERKRNDETISNLNFQIDASEKLVENGNKHLKLCVKKMNQKLFLDGQQKIELGQKRK